MWSSERFVSDAVVVLPKLTQKAIVLPPKAAFVSPNKSTSQCCGRPRHGSHGGSVAVGRLVPEPQNRRQKSRTAMKMARPFFVVCSMIGCHRADGYCRSLQ